MKGVSSAIAAVIIATISVALVGTTYFFSKGMIESATAETFELIDMFGNKIIIKNAGTQPISKLKILIDGNEVENTIEGGSIEPGKIGTIVLTNLEGIQPGYHGLMIISNSMSQTFRWQFTLVTTTISGESTTSTITATSTSTMTTTEEIGGVESIEISVKSQQGTAEIGKPVKWTSKIDVKNPSNAKITDYIVNLTIPKDAEDVVIKDSTEQILTMNENFVKVNITEQNYVSYSAEYETPAPYKEENIIQSFILGKAYRKNVVVKSDFSDHYKNVKAYTNIPEELSKEKYIIRLYRVSGFSKIDLTDNIDYNVRLIDSDNNGLIDRIEWTVPMLSEEIFEVKASINIINVQSYPTVYGNWTVRFNTTGTADLTITPIENTNFDVDIRFLELSCGNEKREPVYDGKSVFYAGWSCSEEGKIVNQVLKPGRHVLEFKFGDDIEYAYNLATLEKAMIAYRSNTGTNGLNSPKYKMWNNETSWGNEIELASAGSPITFVKVVFSPVSSKRIIVTQGNDGYLDAYVSDDGNSWTFSSNIGQISDATKRNFDVDFETATGDAILVYSVVSTSPSCDLAYKVLPANTLSFSGISEQCIDDTGHPTDIQYTWVVTDRNPVSTSEELIVIGFDATDYDNDAWVWNGNSWGNQLEISNDATASGGYKVLSVKYAADGSKGMVVGASGIRGNVNWRYWNGASWSGSATFDINPTNADARWLRLKADPSSDDIQLIAIDSSRDMHAVYWNGASWALTSQIEVNLDSTTTRCVDFAWYPSGNTGILLWDWTGSSTMLRYVTCSPQCPNSPLSIPTYAGTGYWIQAVGNPRNEDNTKILFARLNSNNDIGSINRSSTAFSNYPPLDSAITADTAATAYESFEIAFLLVEPSAPQYGWLNTTLDTPEPIVCTVTTPCDKTQYETFWVNATIECESGSCGTVSGAVRYNNSLNEPNLLVDTTEGAQPFYVLGEQIQFDEKNYVYKNWNFSISGQGTNSSDVAYNGTHFWVIFREVGNTRVYRYKSGGTYDNWNVDFSSDFSAVNGLYVNKTNIIVSGLTPASQHYVFVYTHDGTANEVQSFSLAGQITPPTDAPDVTTNGTYYWVLSSGTNEDYIYRYRSDGTYDNWRIDISAYFGGDGSRLFYSDGMDFNGTHFFVAESGTPIDVIDWYTESGNYLGNFSIAATQAGAGRVMGLALYDKNWPGSYLSGNDKYFYVVEYKKPFIFRYEKNTSTAGFNPISCGPLNQGQKCQLSWNVNVTASTGDYKIDVNFSSNSYPNVGNNDTANAYIRVSGGLSFAILLPEQSWVSSSKTEPESATTAVEFNATSKTQSNVVPCVHDTNCVFKQDDDTPIFKFQNTGNGPEKWNISINETLPSYMTLIGDTDNNPADATTITKDGWIVNSNIPKDGIVDVWLWATYTDAPSETRPIRILHRSMPAP